MEKSFVFLLLELSSSLSSSHYLSFSVSFCEQDQAPCRCTRGVKEKGERERRAEKRGGAIRRERERESEREASKGSIARNDAFVFSASCFHSFCKPLTSFFFSAPGAWPGKPAPPLCPWPIARVSGCGWKKVWLWEARKVFFLFAVDGEEQESMPFRFLFLSLLCLLYLSS